jgi:hypothetical protein
MELEASILKKNLAKVEWVDTQGSSPSKHELKEKVQEWPFMKKTKQLNTQ